MPRRRDVKRRLAVCRSGTVSVPIDDRGAAGAWIDIN